MKLIVGLGNPGKEYINTRHNAGFIAVDSLARKEQLTFSAIKKIDAEISKGTVNSKRAILAKPLTFMNNSGKAVRALLDFYKLKPKDLIIIHDDKDVVLGKTKVQSDRGPAGHNGVKSIIEHVGTQDFTRIRIGVAPENQEDIKDTSGFVLGKFTAEEKNLLKKSIENVINEINQLV